MFRTFLLLMIHVLSSRLKKETKTHAAAQERDKKVRIFLYRFYSLACHTERKNIPNCMPVPQPLSPSNKLSNFPGALKMGINRAIRNMSQSLEYMCLGAHKKHALFRLHTLKFSPSNQAIHVITF